MEQKIKAQREKIMKRKEELLGKAEQKIDKVDPTLQHMKKISSLTKMNTKLLTSIKEEKTVDTEEGLGKISTDKFGRSYSEKELLMEYNLPKSKQEKQRNMD